MGAEITNEEREQIKKTNEGGFVNLPDNESELPINLETLTAEARAYAEEILKLVHQVSEKLNLNISEGRKNKLVRLLQEIEVEASQLENLVEALVVANQEIPEQITSLSIRDKKTLPLSNAPKPKKGKETTNEDDSGFLKLVASPLAEAEYPSGVLSTTPPSMYASMPDFPRIIYIYKEMSSKGTVYDLKITPSSTSKNNEEKEYTVTGVIKVDDKEQRPFSVVFKRLDIEKGKKEAEKPKLDLNKVIDEFKKKLPQVEQEKGRKLLQSEQQELVLELLMEATQKHISETKLASGPISKLFEKFNRGWEKLPDSAQFILSHAFSSTVSLTTGAYLANITSPNGLALRIMQRVGVGALFKTGLEFALKPDLKGRTRRLFSRGNVSTTQVPSFDTEGSSATKTSEEILAEQRMHKEKTITQPSVDLTENHDKTLDTPPKEEGKNMTNEPAFNEKSISTTLKQNLSETLVSTTEVVKSEVEKNWTEKLLSGEKTIVGIFSAASVGTIFALNGAWVAIAAGGGIATRELLDYVLKKREKLHNKNAKPLAKKITLDKTVDEKTFEIVLDENILFKDLENLQKEVAKTARKVINIKKWRKGLDIVGRIFADLGVESAHFFGDTAGTSGSDIVRDSASTFFRRLGKAGQKEHKSRLKERKEMQKELINAPMNRLGELKEERVGLLDEIDFEIEETTLDLKELAEKEELSLEDREAKEMLEARQSELNARKEELLSELSDIKEARLKLEISRLSPEQLQKLEINKQKIQDLKFKEEEQEKLIRPLVEIEREKIENLDEAIIKLSNLLLNEINPDKTEEIKELIADKEDRKKESYQSIQSLQKWLDWYKTQREILEGQTPEAKARKKDREDYLNQLREKSRKLRLEHKIKMKALGRGNEEDGTLDDMKMAA